MTRIPNGRSWWAPSAALIMLLAFSPSPVLADDPPPSAVGAVMKLFQSGRLPAERQGPVVEMICNRGNEHDLKAIFDRLVDPNGFSPALRVKAMSWLADAATTRKVKPAGDLSQLEKLTESGDAAVQLSALKLASLWKIASISKSLQKIALNEKSSPELQQAAIEGLASLGDDGARATLQKLATGDRPVGIRMQAIAGLTAFDLKDAATRAATLLLDATPQDDPADLLNAFFHRKDGADALAAAIEKQPPSVDVAKRSLRYMYSVGRSDAALSTVLSSAAGVAGDPAPPTPEEVARIATDVIEKGDPARGERVFRRLDVSCMRCHSISRAGGQVGPDLSALGGSSPVDYVVNSILNPNLAVKEQYVTKVFILANGMVLTGVVIDRDDNRVRMRDAQGKTVIIPTADIDEEVEGKSLMPQGLTKFLTRDELIDLAKFVSELGKPGPYEIRKVPTIQRWRWLKKPPRELTEEVPHLEHIRQLALGGNLEQWVSAYGMVSGVLPLDELRQGKGPTVLVLQGEIQVNEAGPIAFRISSTEKFQAWVDDKAFEKSSEFTAPLDSGRHTLTLRVEVSDSESPELKVELNKPDGSPAQFEVVAGS